MMQALAVSPALGAGADWPMWRCDAGRGASSPNELPRELHLQWVRQLPPLEPAWPADSARPEDPEMLLFDAAYEPVVVGKTLFLASSRSDSLTALDTETGVEKWVFYADGPIRLAPAASEGKVLFSCDDGHLYCLEATRGRLQWKFRGAPSGRLALGNGRLISAWPARGGPAVADGTVFFAAGIFPFAKTFVHALDTESGKVVWTNGECDWLAPQGYLTVVGEEVKVPGGHGRPATFDRRTGKLLDRFNHPRGGTPPQGAGGFCLAASAGLTYHAGFLYGGRIESGGKKRSGSMWVGSAGDSRGRLVHGCPPVLSREAVFCLDARSGVLRALDPRSPTVREETDSSGRKQQAWGLPEVWALPLGSPSLAARLLLRSGSRLYASIGSTLVAASIPTQGAKPTIAWRAEVEGTPWSAAAADGKLFLTTREGRIFCFGAAPNGEPRRHGLPSGAIGSPRHAAMAAEVLKASRSPAGYALAWGIGQDGLLEELLRQSQLHVVAVDPDERRSAALRRRLDQAGLYGARAAVLSGDPAAVELPPYIASLIVAEEASPPAARKLLACLRPFGGTARFRLSGGQHDALARCVAEARLGKLEARTQGDLTLVTRTGPPPGSGQWSHQHADAANTCFSRDRLDAPFGVLWWGGTFTDKIILDSRPNSGAPNVGPSPRVAGGRLVMAGPDVVRAVDAYTGRVLWTAALPGLSAFVGGYPNTYWRNNLVALEDAIYVACGERCLCLDPATGAAATQFRLPPTQGRKPTWGHILVWEELLIAAVEAEGERVTHSRSSRRLAVLDRHKGETLWTREAAGCFPHMALCAGAAKVFCVDRPAGEPAGATLLALDARKGSVAWSTQLDFAASWLAYSQDHDIVVAADAVRVVACRGRDGAALWDRSIARGDRPLVLHRDVLITQGSNRGEPPAAAYSLLSDEPWLIEDPRSGRKAPWQCPRGKCASGVASENLFFFRDGYAAYQHIGQNARTYLNGIRPGCASPAVPADGVVSLPLYGRHCTCSFQLKTSLALVPVREAP